MMRALTFDPATDEFQQSEVRIPEPGPGDALIRVDACGLNPVDAKIGSWKTMAPEMDANWVPGLDVSGEIVELGEGASGYKVSDRVLCHGNMFRPHGGFAEYTIQDAATLIPHPDVPATVAAATPCAGWTAWRALNDKLHARRHDSILITGGSGGVGGFATQIAAYFQIEKRIVTCSASNHAYVTSLGATHVIDYRSEDVIATVLSITNQEGVAIGLDTVGGENDILVANCLGFEGEMVELVDTVRPREYADAFGKGLSFHQLSLGAGHRFGPASKGTLATAGIAFSLLLEKGHLRVPELKTISLAETGEALGEMLKQRTVGKIVMTPRSD